LLWQAFLPLFFCQTSPYQLPLATWQLPKQRIKKLYRPVYTVQLLLTTVACNCRKLLKHAFKRLQLFSCTNRSESQFKQFICKFERPRTHFLRKARTVTFFKVVFSSLSFWTWRIFCFWFWWPNNLAYCCPNLSI
jgi:hypothetical protein